MLKLIIPALLLALQTPPAPTAPTTQQIRDVLQAVQQQLAALLARLPATPPIATPAELQAALDAGGTVTLAPGLTYAGTFVIRTSGTILVGRQSALSGTGGPALRIAPGVVDVVVSDLVATSDDSGAVLQCGDNGSTQTTRAQQPQRITVRNLSIPTHRGKRGIEWNCGGTIVSSSVLDVWASSLQDSQAIAMINSCGPLTVQGGTYVAASENIMVGGDRLKITDCPEGVATDLLLEDVTLLKPDAWRTDGVKRAVKNLLELKAGKRITVRRARLSGSWGPAFLGVQDGSAIVITPKNGQFLADITLEDLEVDRAAGGLQLLGTDYNSVTPIATTNVTVRRSTFRGLTKSWGGRGILAIVTGGMQAATFDQVDATFDGPAIIVCGTETPVGPLAFTGGRMTTGGYGVMAPGVNYGGAPPAAYAARPCVTTFQGNTFAGAPSTFKTNYPANTWTTRAELDLLLQAAR